MTSSSTPPQVVFVFSFVAIQFLFMIMMMPQHVNCQLSIHKTSHSTDNCTTAHTTYFQKSLSGSCSEPSPKCESSFNSKTNMTSYYMMECATEFPTPAYGFLYIYLYLNRSSQCSGPLQTVTVKALNVCMNDLGSSDYVMYDSLGYRTVFNDKYCTSKNRTTSMFLDECLLGQRKVTTLGHVPPPQPPQPPQPPTPAIIYSRTGLYNISMSGGTTCLASAMTAQFYSGPVSSCPTLECKESVVKFGGETFYQNTDCVNELPSGEANGNSVHIYRHIDQNSCQNQSNVVLLEVYPINSCSPYASNSNGVIEFGFIKSDDCKVIRKYNDSSCLNEISQVDLSARNGICDAAGVKYLCNAIIAGSGDGGNGGNGGGGVTPGNSTRVVVNSSETMYHLSLIVFVSVILNLLISI